MTCTSRDAERSSSVQFEYAQRSTGHLRRFVLHGNPDDHIFKCVRAAGVFYERDLLDAVSALAPASGWAVDVGANIGNHSVYFAGVIGLRVACIEPFPSAIELLRRNIEANNLVERATIIEAAASDKRGHVNLAAPSDNLGMARVVSDESQSAVCVRAATLDELLSENGIGTDARICVLKIDVEGHEKAVVAGATRILREHRPLVVVELFGESEQREMDAALRPHGYKRFGPWCSTPTWIYSTHRLRTPAVLLARKVLRRIARPATHTGRAGGATRVGIGL